MVDARAAFESRDPYHVAQIALETVGSKEECLSFFAKVLEAVASGPGVSSIPSEKRKPDEATKPPAQEPAKKSKNDELNFFESDIEGNQGSIFLLVPNALVGSIIGKGGATIKSMTKRFGSKVEVEKTSTYGENRLVSVMGPLKQITLTTHFISTALSGALDSVSMLVPNGLCGLIIGKQGSNIKKLEKETGANLKMDNDADVHSDARKIVISGSLKSQCHAQYLIASLISANEGRLGVFDPRVKDEPQQPHLMPSQAFPGQAGFPGNSMMQQQRMMQERQMDQHQMQDQQMMRQMQGQGMPQANMVGGVMSPTGNQGMGMGASGGAMMGGGNGMNQGMAGAMMNQGMGGGMNQGMGGGMMGGQGMGGGGMMGGQGMGGGGGMMNQAMGGGMMGGHGGGMMQGQGGMMNRFMGSH